jgi:class 3 adenylate cyclase
VDSVAVGFFATFDSPANAIRCACAIRDAVKELGLAVRVGVHAGEAPLSCCCAAHKLDTNGRQGL